MDEGLLMQAKKSPDTLTKSTLSKMREYLTTMQGGDGAEREMAPVAMAYLTSVLLPSRGKDISMRSSGELKTLARTLDLLMTGRVAEAADMVSQRFQAVETADQEGSWSAARHLELMAEPRVSAVPQEHRRRAIRMEKSEARLQRDAASFKGGPQEKSLPQ